MLIGEKIKRLRIQHGLTQEELANRCELSKGFISQIERELTSPSIATLTDILECLGSSLSHFFTEPAAEKVVFPAESTFVSTDEALGTKTRWLVPNAQKNIMEPILLELSPGGRTPEDNPHDGEEFGYVLSGTVLIHLGGQHHRARKGESFYFSATMPHSISNPGKQPARIVWVATPPSF